MKNFRDFIRINAFLYQNIGNELLRIIRLLTITSLKVGSINLDTQQYLRNGFVPDQRSGGELATYKVADYSSLKNRGSETLMFTGFGVLSLPDLRRIRQFNSG